MRILPRPNHMVRDQRRPTRYNRRFSCPITAQCAKRGTGSNFAAFAKVRTCTPFCPVRIIWFEISDALHVTTAAFHVQSRHSVRKGGLARISPLLRKFVPVPLFAPSESYDSRSATPCTLQPPLFMSNLGTVCKKGDWLEFRRFCESSCLHPFLPRPNHKL